MNTLLKWTIALLMAVTLFRVQTIFFLPTLELFDGISPNGWLGPWLSDFILGLLVLPMVFLFLTRRGPRIWGILVAYNSVGAFDYSQGLVAQYVSPMPEEMASAATVYGGIGFFMVCQVIAIALMFRQDVTTHFHR
ncbi:MAG: hypothetical protein AAGC77_03875 [Pseudomonadota bacterium]